MWDYLIKLRQHMSIFWERFDYIERRNYILCAQISKLRPQYQFLLSLWTLHGHNF